MPKDTTAAMIRVPWKKTGPPESPLQLPPLPWDGFAVVLRLYGVTELWFSTRYASAISRSRKDTCRGVQSVTPYPLVTNRAFFFDPAAARYSSIAPASGRIPNSPDGGVYGVSRMTT